MEDPRQLMRYLTIEDILIIAEAQVGNYHFLHKEQLDYLVDAVSAKFSDVEYYPTLFQKAAIYAHHIIKRHVFLDGNKRIGLTCSLKFLNLNGCNLRPDINDSIIKLGYAITDGSINDIAVIADHIQSWVCEK